MGLVNPIFTFRVRFRKGPTLRPKKVGERGRQAVRTEYRPTIRESRSANLPERVRYPPSACSSSRNPIAPPPAHETQHSRSSRPRPCRVEHTEQNGTDIRLFRRPSDHLSPTGSSRTRSTANHNRAATYELACLRMSLNVSLSAMVAFGNILPRISPRAGSANVHHSAVLRPPLKMRTIGHPLFR